VRGYHAGERAGPAAIPGAQRVVDFTVDHVIATARALPLRWVLEERSRFNPPARVYTEA
jgi:hypothetical protein